MLKSLTISLSLSLAVAARIFQRGKAGGLDKKSALTCGLASPQGGPYASGHGWPDRDWL